MSWFTLKGAATQLPSPPPPMRTALTLLAAVLLPELVGAVAGMATASSVGTWYATLDKPAFTPPSWVFMPAWTTLYALMGVASWLVWREGVGRPEVRGALVLYGVQLALNGAWSLIFFGARRPGLALVEVVVLLGLVLWTTGRFFPVSRAAGWLMVPYAAWTAFATALNAGIWWLNRG